MLVIVTIDWLAVLVGKANLLSTIQIVQNRNSVPVLYLGGHTSLAVRLLANR